MESLRVRQEVALDSAKDRAIAVLQSAARGWLQRRALLSLLLDSIPAPSKEAMIFVEKIPLADAQPFKLRSYALKHWGAVRAIAVRTKPDGEMPEGLSPADMARWKADDQMRDFPRSWAVVWMESKDKAAAAVAGQEEAIASKKQYFSSATPAGPPTGQQFGIRKCDWTRIHSGKAITLLSKIWKSVPMAVVSSIPRGFAEEGKVRALFTQFGPVDAIGVANEKDQSWALVTFRHETSILKATSQPVEVGADAHLLHVEKAQFSQVTELNKLTVQEQRGWDPLAEAGGVTGGLAGAAAGAKSKAPQKSETAGAFGPPAFASPTGQYVGLSLTPFRWHCSSPAAWACLFARSHSGNSRCRYAIHIQLSLDCFSLFPDFALSLPTPQKRSRRGCTSRSKPTPRTSSGSSIDRLSAFRRKVGG